MLLTIVIALILNYHFKSYTKNDFDNEDFELESVFSIGFILLLYPIVLLVLAIRYLAIVLSNYVLPK